MHDRPTALSLSLSDGHSEAVANLLKTALSSPTNMSQQWCAPPRHFRCMLLLLGSCVLLSIVALFSLWTKLPSHGSLRRASVAVAAPVSSQAEDLFSLVQKRQHKMDTLSRELLHLDDLASSDSYQQWAPLVVSKCMHGMDERTAPCIKEANRTNLVEAQELLYPSFRLKLPTFASAMMKADWLSKGLHVDRMRVSEDRVWANYPTFQGQNMVFSNAVFRGNPPPDVWSEQGCMGRAVSHASFAHGPKAREMKTTTSVDTLVVATSLDSWSFQHFIDRVAVVWSQAQLVIPTTKKSETAIVSGKEPRDSIVNQIYQVMVGRHLHKPGTVLAKRLVFSCRAPLIHPFTTHASRKIFYGHWHRRRVALIPTATSFCSSPGRRAAKQATAGVRS
jgi:hypothetical protein